jgi:hypothetical protein
MNSPEVGAAVERLADGYYNSDPVGPDNPGGFADDGHQTNFPAALADVGAVAGMVGDVGALAEQAVSDVGALRELIHFGPDPGAVGAGRLWVTDGGQLLVRNAANAGWSAPVLSPAATEAVAGLARRATEAEALAGVEPAAYLSPATGAKMVARAVFIAGAPITASLTLTASDANLRDVAMEAPWQSIKLPDATGLAAGRQYRFRVAGGCEAGVRDAAGVLVARLAAGVTVTLTLVGAAGAAGVWAVEGEGALLPISICDHSFIGAIGGDAGFPALSGLRLTDTLSLHFVMSTAGVPYVLAVNHATAPATVGQLSLLHSGVQSVASAFRVSDTKAIVSLSVSAVYHVTVTNVTTCAVAVSAAAGGPMDDFFGPPVTAVLSDTLYVTARANGGQIQAFAVSAAGANPVAAGSSAVAGVYGATVHAVYRVSATQACVIFTAGSAAPYSLGAVLVNANGGSVGFGVHSIGGSNGPSSTEILSAVQLTATTFIVVYHAAGAMWAVPITVTGVATVGTPINIIAASGNLAPWAGSVANRYQPNLYRLSDTRALLSMAAGSGVPSKHVVIQYSGGALSMPGLITHRVWLSGAGGNFPQAAGGFLAYDRSNSLVHAVSLVGPNLHIRGAVAVPGLGTLALSHFLRFGLSGNYLGIAGENGVGGSFGVRGVLHLFRFCWNAAPQYLGSVALTNSQLTAGGSLAGELAWNKVSILSRAVTQHTDGQATLSLNILEFPK